MDNICLKIISMSDSFDKMCAFWIKQLPCVSVGAERGLGLVHPTWSAPCFLQQVTCFVRSTGLGQSER